jgi:hypothetical protein
VIAEDSSVPEGASRLARITPLHGNAQPQMIPGLEFVGDLTASAVEAEDIDADGVNELLFRRDIGHPSNVGREIFFFDASNRRFVHDTVISSHTNVQADSTGCVRTSGFLGGASVVEERVCRDAARHWQVVWRLLREPDSTGVLVEREYRLRSGQLVPVSP